MDVRQPPQPPARLRPILLSEEVGDALLLPLYSVHLLYYCTYCTYCTYYTVPTDRADYSYTVPTLLYTLTMVGGPRARGVPEA